MRGVSNRTEEDVFDYLDDLEDIIGDDAFAAFLNNEAEIQNLPNPGIAWDPAFEPIFKDKLLQQQA